MIAGQKEHQGCNYNGMEDKMRRGTEALRGYNGGLTYELPGA